MDAAIVLRSRIGTKSSVLDFRCIDFHSIPRSQWRAAAGWIDPEIERHWRRTMKTPSSGSNPFSSFTRRDFIKTASAAAMLPRAAWAGAGRASASNRITLGVVGWGMMGPANTKAFLANDDCQVVAACDLDKNHLQAAVDTVNGKYGNTDCKAYHDYREMRSEERRAGK